MLEFLSFKTEAFGLQITDSHIRAVDVKKKAGHFFCRSMRQSVLEKGIVAGGAVKDAKKLSEAVKDCLKKTVPRIEKKYAVISLPEDKAFLQVIQMPKVGARELDLAVSFEAENYIPMPMEKVCLDYSVIPSMAEVDHLDILLAAFPKDIIDSYVEAVIGAGLKPIALELESQAVSRTLFGDSFTESPLLIVEVGDNRTNLIIRAGYSLRFSFSIPISNEYFLETISKELGLDREKAKELKIKYGIEKYSKKSGLTDHESNVKASEKKDHEEDSQRKIFESLIPGLVDLTQQISKYLNYYHTHANHEHLAKNKRAVSEIYLCGSGADLKGLDQLISLKFNLPVKIVNIPIGDSLAKEEGHKSGSECAFTTAYGLAVRGMNGGEKKH